MDRKITTEARLKELLNYDPFTGNFTWKVDRGRLAKAGAVAGTVNRLGYVVIKIDQRQHQAHRLAFLYMLGRWPKDDVLHTDGRTTDNRWHMLGEGTRSENMRDQKIRCNNKTGVAGVSRRNRKWLARIKINNKDIWLGSFDDKADAIAARRSAEREHGFISRPRTQTPLNGHG